MNLSNSLPEIEFIVDDSHYFIPLGLVKTFSSVIRKKFPKDDFVIYKFENLRDPRKMFSLIINLFYGQEIDINQDNAFFLGYVADILGIAPLSEATDSYRQIQLTTDNIFNILNYLDAFHITESKIIKFAGENWPILSKSEKSYQLSSFILDQIFSQNPQISADFDFILNVIDSNSNFLDFSQNEKNEENFSTVCGKSEYVTLFKYCDFTKLTSFQLNELFEYVSFDSFPPQILKKFIQFISIAPFKNNVQQLNADKASKNDDMSKPLNSGPQSTSPSDQQKQTNLQNTNLNNQQRQKQANSPNLNLNQQQTNLKNSSSNNQKKKKSISNNSNLNQQSQQTNLQNSSSNNQQNYPDKASSSNDSKSSPNSDDSKSSHNSNEQNHSNTSHSNSSYSEITIPSFGVNGCRKSQPPLVLPPPGSSVTIGYENGYELRGVIWLFQETSKLHKNSLWKKEVDLIVPPGTKSDFKYNLVDHSPRSYWNNFDGKKCTLETAWIIVGFPNCSLLLTHYTIAAKGDKIFYSQPMSWKILGSDDPENFNENDMICYVKNAPAMNIPRPMRTFEVEKKTRPYSYFKFVMIKNFTKLQQNQGELSLTGIELFGVLNVKK